MAIAELTVGVAGRDHNKPYLLDIEGTIHRWPVSIIIPEQVAELGGWDFSAGVVLIDADNNERQLKAGEVVHLKPGMGFAKKVHWKRGR